MSEYSIDQFDPSTVSGRLGKRRVAGDDRRINRYCEGDVHSVVGADVVSQLPCAIQEIEVGMTMEIDVCEIGNRFPGTASRQFAGPHKSAEPLNHFDIHEMRRMDLFRVAKEPGFDPRANRSLQEKLQQG
jgi:hypothetical protein